MGRVIKLTLLADVSSCITMLIVLTIADDFRMGIYAGLLTFGNILLPTLLAVLIYVLIKPRTTLKDPILTVILQAILLTGLFILGLFVWASGEAAIFKTLSWAETKKVFDSEFAGFLPVVFSEAILIPIYDLFLTRSKEK